MSSKSKTKSSSSSKSDSKTSSKSAPPETTTTVYKVSPSSKAMSSPSSKSPSKRLIQELQALSDSPPSLRNPAIERLAPVDEEDLFVWEAVINGRGLGGGYEEGRWLLRIVVPDGRSSDAGSGKGKGKDDGGKAYPFAPPQVRFVTKICASNVAFETGEICLDLLKTAWTPAYTLSTTIDAIWQMLAIPGVDSPLNIEVAALLRDGDQVGAEGLVKWCSGEWRWDGR